MPQISFEHQRSEDPSGIGPEGFFILRIGALFEKRVMLFP